MEHARRTSTLRTSQHHHLKRNQKMKIASSQKTSGYSRSELLVTISLSSIILGAAITCGISLRQSFNATDNYLATHIQQVRIIDYLNRDVKRGLVVTTSVDLQSVTMTVPSYLIQASDSEAVANPSPANAPRTPAIAYGTSGWQVNYGAAPTSVVYSINGNSIVRVENGTVTTIASST